MIKLYLSAHRKYYWITEPLKKHINIFGSKGSWKELRIMAMVIDSKLSSRTKYIDIRYHFIKQKVDQRDGELCYVSTEDNTADMMTKPLGTTRATRKLRKMIGLLEGSN